MKKVPLNTREGGRERGGSISEGRSRAWELSSRSDAKVPVNGARIVKMNQSPEKTGADEQMARKLDNRD